MKKRTAQTTLKSMPDEFQLDELLERLVFIEQVEKGLVELKEGKGIPHDKVMASIKRKWRK
jgi:predicted transcriptional regulator